MRHIPIILLSYVFALLMASSAGANSAEDYLAVFGLSGRMGDPNYYDYSPAFAEFMTQDNQPGSTTPVYLGRAFYRQPVLIGHNRPTLGDFQGARWYPMWPYNGSLMNGARFIPSNDPLNMTEYHVPSIVEFLSPNWAPERSNYSNYVPALGEFANASWRPPQADYSLHVPAIGEFLSEEWQSPRPNPADYPAWMMEYLRN
jgi:hypothetical protein